MELSLNIICNEMWLESTDHTLVARCYKDITYYVVEDVTEKQIFRLSSSKASAALLSDILKMVGIRINEDELENLICSHCNTIQE